MYIGDRKEREEHMDNLEWQMEDQREQMQRTLDRMEGSGRRGGALERLRGSLPRFPGRAPARYAGETREEGPRPRKMLAKVRSPVGPRPGRCLPQRS